MGANETLKKVGIQELEESFAEAFTKAASMNYLDTYEVVAEDDDKGLRRVVVQVSQMSGAPDPAGYKKNAGLQKVEVPLPHDPPMIFKLAGVEVRNTFEYHASYYPA
jgi:hypothetical protein